MLNGDRYSKRCRRWNAAGHAHALTFSCYRQRRLLLEERLATGQRRQAYQFWQKGGGYDRNVTKVETLIEMVRYIHNNPVRRGLVQTAEEWYYSSAAQWEGLRAGPMTVDKDSFPTF